ncbi:hypothetical protein D3C74_408050 [compost metagenome]
MAIRIKLKVACARENTPVTVAAMANLKATKPDASFINASPSRSLCMLLGKCTRPAIAPTATASVGDNMAARAKAAGNGIVGISQ